MLMCYNMELKPKLYNALVYGLLDFIIIMASWKAVLYAFDLRTN